MTWTAATQQSEAWAEVSRSAEAWAATSIGTRVWGSGNGLPVIDAISPESGVPGTLLTITGHNFTGVTSVTIDGLEADFTIVSDSTITATVP